MPTLNFVFDNQLILSGILTQLSSRKQFASRRKRSLEKEGNDDTPNYNSIDYNWWLKRLDTQLNESTNKNYQSP